MAVASVCGLLLALAPAPAQMPTAEHQRHHPAQPAAAMPPAQAAGSAQPLSWNANAAQPTGGGMAGMGGMCGMCSMCMDKMAGVPPPNELYPSLMALPELSPEQRQQAGQQAAGWINAGASLMNQALGELGRGAQANDLAAMDLSTAKLREGIGQLESGIAARRALAEGRAPREIALQWFQRELNLPVAAAPAHDNRFGSMRFHLLVIALLAAVAVTLIALSILKLRRASALLVRLGGNGPPEGGSGLAGKSTPPAGPQPGAGSVSAPAPDPGGAGKTAAAAPASAAPAQAAASGRWSGTLRVSRIFDETPDVRTFRLVAADGGPLPFTYRPGQFLTVAVTLEGRRVQRSYTIASSPTQRHYCELTIKREERGTASPYLHDGLQEGELLEAAGPGGAFVFTGAEAPSVVLIGGGVGITPLMSITRYLTDTGWGGEVFLLYSCRTARDIIFREELERLAARHPKLHLVITITRPGESEAWDGRTGYFTREVIAESVPDIAARRIHLCGPERMMRSVQAALIEFGVPASSVKTESFDSGGAAPPAAAPAAAPAATPDAPANRAGQAAAAVAAPRPEAAAGSSAASVAFSRSAKSAPLPPDKSILEASEDVGVNIPYQCRVGICGTCKVRLLSGDVTMAVQEALTAEDKAAGIILACQAKSTGDCTVEA